MGIGMPQTLYLDDFGSIIWDVFGSPPYHVGSSLNKKIFRDVDVVLIIDDEKWENEKLGDPNDPHKNAKWVGITKAFSALGEKMVGFQVDFKIQQRTYANKNHEGGRSALGMVPHRFIKDKK